MTKKIVFPELNNWDSTKATLHAYSKVIGAVPRAHAIPHQKWWHISLKVAPDGLVTENIALPGGGIFNLKMNFHSHSVQLISSHNDVRSWSMAKGLTANQLAEKVLGAVKELGLDGEYVRQKFENDDLREYNPAQAANYFSILVNVERVFQLHRMEIKGEKGPVQLWPHGFDLAFEWFGTRQIEFEEHGQKTNYPSQINLGFSPGEPNHPEPYFYSNPFPFEDGQLVHQPLPHGARWFIDSWKGSLLAYSGLVGKANGTEILLDYARAVYDLASPGLMA